MEFISFACQRAHPIAEKSKLFFLSIESCQIFRSFLKHFSNFYPVLIDINEQLFPVLYNQKKICQYYQMSDKKTQMTQEDASRIQSHADRTDTNQDFKSRAQSAGDRNANESQSGDNQGSNSQDNQSKGGSGGEKK